MSNALPSPDGDDPTKPSLDAHGYDPADYDWVPVLRKARADGWTPQRQRAFIGHLADCGVVRIAARQVGMDDSSAYKLRRAPDAAGFAAARDAAMHQAAHALIDVAFDRAFNGSDEPVYDRDGRRVGRRHRHSDGLLIFLLRKHIPDRYGDLHRDRAALPSTVPPAPAAPPPAEAETMVALGPVQPADPLALMAPEDARMALECADILDGKLARWHRQDGSAELEPGAPDRPADKAPDPVDFHGL